ncbi:MAG: hypothetical protein HY537_18175 [Deltaproteobacteria bacterium]|nr:hypothetical protein [Deltaproteobacteria bacterium]
MGLKKQNPRLDCWVRLRFPSLTGRHIEEAIKTGLVYTSDGKQLKKGDRFASDQDIDYSRLHAHLSMLKRGTAQLVVPIVFETDAYLIVDKPAGIASHPLSLYDTETITHWALARYPGIEAEFKTTQPIITPHRLDNGTSGLLVVAKTSSAFHSWRLMFSRKEVKKKYLAWCWGQAESCEFSISTPIGHSPNDPARMVTVKNRARFRPPLQQASSFVKVIRQDADRFLCEVSCETGVTHQVRVHLASVGFPLLGDQTYDPVWMKRGEIQRYHQLRAFELTCGQQTWSAPVAEFISSHIKT